MALQITDRDQAIFRAIHWYDGLLSEQHIHRVFFPEASKQRMQDRLRELIQHEYLHKQTIRRSDFRCVIYWLATRGADEVAASQDKTLSEFSYLKKPREADIPHQVAVNEVRITMKEACALHPRLVLLEPDYFLGEAPFRAQPDEVSFFHGGSRVKSQIVPDGYLSVAAEVGEEKRRYSFLLEGDRVSHALGAFERDKVLAGLAYVRSAAYRKRFGTQAGLWLIVTTGTVGRRLKYLKRRAENAIGRAAQAFFFTTFEQVKPETVFTEPIWYRGGEEEPGPLFRP